MESGRGTPFDWLLPSFELGPKGGKARAERLTPEQRSEAARKAADARWKPRKQQ